MGNPCSIDGCIRAASARGWCSMHWKRWYRYGDPLHVQRIIGDPEARFWSKVDKNGPVPIARPDLGCCWIWTASTNDGDYGTVGWGTNASQTWLAHRVAYELEFGAIPPGTELDHLCRVHPCVRPSHLEAVAHLVNVQRGVSPSQTNAAKTECIRGHAFTPENTETNADGHRRCRICKRDYMRKYQRQRRASGRG